jgi:glutamyl-tRNA reductase
MSPPSIVCLGLSHQTAPIELRERLSCSLSDLGSLTKQSSGRSSIDGTIGELVLISTCNRLEIYARVDSEAIDAQSLLTDQLTEARGVDAADVGDHTYFYTGRNAVQHLFSVAAGLDSLVLGEPQILGQVTDAYTSAVESKSTGPLLSALLKSAIRVGKRARTETAISSNPASISSMAIAKAQEIVGDLRFRRPLVVGMGEMGQLAMSSLQSRGVKQIAVANRTRERAETFAEGCSGDVYTMAELAEALVQADVVISATAAPHVIFHPEMVREAMAQRTDKELILVDIAVPRDVDPAVGDIPGVHLFDIDDLKGSLDEALAARRKEAPKVEAIIREEVAEFEAILRQMSIRPLLVGMRQKAETIRQRELERSLRFLGEVDPETFEQLQLFSRSLVNKLLHEPTIRLKEKANNGESAEYAEFLRHLFSLEASVETNRNEW